MIKTTPLQTALIAALLGSVALVGCKKKEESTDSNAAPAATAPAEPAAPAPMTTTSQRIVLMPWRACASSG
ncbi:hypothetical protein G6F66_014436 [Rhizopus arrhizus]|nr:hypothetical protein G6F66_014436 [Rhizopus arrhizus]